VAGEKAYLSITQLTTLINGTLETEYPNVYFCGEISEINFWSSGHVYVTLKDERSQVYAVMWRSQVTSLTFKPKQGDSVLCSGRPNLYHKNGRFQMVITSMQPAGEGALQKRFLELKAKLEKEGLFDPTRKRPLPFLPSVIGVVTSAQGAVIHDIMVRIQERMPNLIVYLADVKVQGPGCAEEVADAIRRLNRRTDIEVIIVARGGGSLEDLWGFNEEVVVRAIFASRIPVMSGIGHEVDITLADLVADIRAPTPTAAAEMVVPKRADLLRTIAELERRLTDTDRWLQPLAQAVDECAARLVRRMSGVIEEARLSLSAAEAHLKTLHPVNLLATLRLRIQALRERLSGAGVQTSSRLQQKLDSFDHRLRVALPRQKLLLFSDRIHRCRERLLFGFEKQLQSRKQQVNALGDKLSALSPRRVLERGYSLVQRGSEIIKSTDQLAVGNTLKVSFAKGAVKANVTEKL
jgi:exodeoxyribonuclease VII large subunit